MWTEAVKNFAEYGRGNMLFLDGSPDGMQRSMNQIMGMMKMQKDAQNGNAGRK
jgi:prepilin-type processing-associated H-X9-DG protein